MAYENTGRLFKNERKTQPNQPDYTGDFTDAYGVKMQVAAWLKDGTEGRPKWLSFRISEQQQKPAEATGGEDLDDEIPF